MTDQGPPPPPFTPSREMSAYPAYPRSSYPPPGYEGPPPSKTMSTWALVLGLIPMPLGNLVAIGLAIEVLSTVEVGPCSQPHSGEVFASFDLADGPFPGDAQVLRLAEGGCFKRLGKYVGEARDVSKLEVYAYYPVKATWSLDQGVTCMVTTASPTSGSLKGTES